LAEAGAKALAVGPGSKVGHRGDTICAGFIAALPTRKLDPVAPVHSIVAASSHQGQYARVCVEAIVRDLAIAEEPHDWNVAKRLLDRLELMGFVPE
jgi:hypothetical protein